MFLQMDTGMIPQTWMTKKSLQTFMTNLNTVFEAVF